MGDRAKSKIDLWAIDISKPAVISCRMLRYFLCDYTTGADIAADDAKEADLVTILDAFADMSPAEENFFGVINEHGTLQVWFKGDGRYELDVPVPARGGSMCRKILSHEDCEAAIRLVAGGATPAELPGLDFVKW